MPEILTKNPELVLHLLNEVGAKCGKDEKPLILTKCPPESFCSLSGGELCVYGLNNVSSMTQISAHDLHHTFNQIPSMFSFINIGLVIFVFLIGTWIGRYIK